MRKSIEAPTHTWVVVKGDFVGNEKQGFSQVYYSDLTAYPTQDEAILAGWSKYGHDDWYNLELVYGAALLLSWMEEPREDLHELAEVASQLGLELA